MLQNTITVDLMGVQHVVGYPSVGQKFQIESAKILFSNGTYAQLAVSNYRTAEELLDIIDAYSYFSVLIPNIGLAFTPETLQKMDLLTSDKLRKEFRKYYKFYTGFEMAMLKQISGTNDEQTTTTNQSTGL